MKVAICGYYGKHNFGDDIMMAELKKLFTDLGHEVSIYSDEASDGILDGCDQSHNLIEENDVIVIGGGGILTGEFWFFKRFLGTVVKDQLYEKKKFLFLNVNITPQIEEIFPALERIKSLWVVRDSHSTSYLTSKFVDRLTVFSAPDISFRYFNGIKAEPQPKQLSIICNYYIFGKYFSTNVEDKLKVESAYFALKSYLDWMMSFGWNVNYVYAQKAELVDDRVTNAILYGLNNCRGNWILDENPVEILRKSSMIISSRYHTTAFAYAKEIPFIDLTHHDKNANFIRDYKLENNSLDFFKLNKGDLSVATKKMEKTAIMNNQIGVKTIEDWTKLQQIIQEYINEQRTTL